MEILSNNPFFNLTEIFNPIAMQLFVIAMVALVIIGTLIDIIHKKNVQYFFNNAKKAKLSATREIGSGERVAVIAKTIVHDIATTSELGAGKRRAAHLLGMYGTIIFWISSAVLVFCYTSSTSGDSSTWSIL